MALTKYEVTRDVDQDDCPWLKETVPAGTVVYHFRGGSTYGCISPWGQAVTHDENGDYPFFELPTEALRVVS